MNKAIKPAFTRLFDAQQHWHDADKGYFDPRQFRIAINSCIQDLRNVTFLLQSNKRSIDGFDNWYVPWQEKMRANPSLRWLVSARNRIVKQGDLDLNSVLRVEIIGSYKDGDFPIFEKSYDSKLTNKELFEAIPNNGLPKEVLEHSYIKLERRWVDQNYDEHELLELLSTCWIAVAQLLSDAPDAGVESMKSSSLPPCMYKGSEARSIWMKVQGDNLIPTHLYTKTVEITDTVIDEIKEKYPESPLLQTDNIPSNFKGTCERMFKQATYLLQKDGYHIHLAVIFKESKQVNVIEIANDDRADKYRTMRHIASEIEKVGADEFLMISEAWRAPFDPVHPNRHPVDSPDRNEVLTLVGLTQSGEGYSYTAPFTRNGKEIKFSQTELINHSIEKMSILQPIVSVWQLNECE